MKATVRVDGLDRIAKALATLSARAQRRIVRKVLLDNTRPLESHMAGNAPKGDPQAPNLAENIGTSAARSPVAADIAAVAIGPTQEVAYGRFQEWGTARHPAHAFVRPAFDSTGPRVVASVQRGLWEEIIVRGLVTARGTGGGGGLL